MMLYIALRNICRIMCLYRIATYTTVMDTRLGYVEEGFESNYWNGSSGFGFHNCFQVILVITDLGTCI